MINKGLLFVIITIILFFSFYKFFLKNNNPYYMQNNRDNIEYKKFDYLDFGVYFEFPNFKDWEYAYTEKVNKNLCIMYFNWPDNVLYEVPPQMHIYKVLKNAEANEAGLQKNSHGIPYERVQDPSLYVTGHKFEEGDWDWLIFYGPNFNIKMEHVLFGEPPFDKDFFYQKIIETFKF